MTPLLTLIIEIVLTKLLSHLYLKSQLFYAIRAKNAS